MNKLSVVIPSYNEELRIGKTLLAVSDFLKKQTYEYEILVRPIFNGKADVVFGSRFAGAGAHRD